MSQDTLSDVLRAGRLRGAVFDYVGCSATWSAEALQRAKWREHCCPAPIM